MAMCLRWFRFFLFRRTKSEHILEGKAHRFFGYGYVFTVVSIYVVSWTKCEQVLEEKRHIDIFVLSRVESCGGASLLSLWTFTLFTKNTHSLMTQSASPGRICVIASFSQLQREKFTISYSDHFVLWGTKLEDFVKVVLQLDSPLSHLWMVSQHFALQPQWGTYLVWLDLSLSHLWVVHTIFDSALGLLV